MFLCDKIVDESNFRLLLIVRLVSIEFLHDFRVDDFIDIIFGIISTLLIGLFAEQF